MNIQIELYLSMLIKILLVAILNDEIAKQVAMKTPQLPQLTKYHVEDTPETITNTNIPVQYSPSSYN
jgi:hypothetical protein